MKYSPSPKVSQKIQRLAFYLNIIFALFLAAPAWAARPAPPAAPTGLTATAASSSQINLRWTDNASNETGYYVYRAASSSGPWTLIATLGAGSVSYSSTGLASSTTYYFQVCAYNSKGSSAYATASATTLAVVASCTYTISTTSASYSSAGGTGSINVSSGTGCSWTASSADSWITITAGANGSANGTVSYSVAANTSTSSRTGTMTVAGQTVTVNQAGAACTYAISTTSASYAAAGGSGSVSVTAGAGCSWTASTTDAWISITAGASGSANGTVSYSVAANTSTSSRTGTMTIAGQTVTVTQAGAACTYALSATSASFAAAGGTGSVSVTAGAGCSWTASSGAAWVTITAGTSGSGSGTVTYSVLANTATTARTAALTIAGQTFTVSQAAASSGPDITSNLVGYWTADTANVSGSTVFDTSGAANNGTLGGTTLPAIVTGRIAQAASLTDSSQLVSVPDSASLNLTGPFTVAAWVQFSTLPGAGKYPNVVAKLTSPSGYYGYGMYWNGAGVAGIVGPGTATWYTTPAYTPVAGVWHHYVSVFDGSKLTLYVDGALFSQVASAAPGSTASIPVKMGPHYSNPTTYGVINGLFDDVRIYGRALTATDVSSLYSLAGSSCTYALSATGVSADYLGGSSSVGVTSGTGCAWTATSSASWITITSGSSGSGNGTVSYTVAGNTATTARTGTMTIAGQTFTVTQSGAPASCTYAISGTSASFASAGGSSSVGVTSGTGCSWTAVSGAAWITITAGASGSGNGTVSYSVAANTSTASRSATMTIAGQTFTVNQAGAPCTYALSATSASFAAAGGSGNVGVTSSGGCAWTASSGATWITITAGASGSGSGTVSYSVAANTSTSSRSGTMTIAGQTFTVSQAGAACTYGLSATSASYSSASASGTVTVTAGAGCAWSASTASTWISITAGATGTGSGTVYYSVQANTATTSRTDTITIAGQTFTVTQAAASDTTAPAVSVTSPSSGATVSATVSVSANASDNVGVSKVEIYRDGTTLLAADTASPYSVNDDTTKLSNGSHSYMAKAYDAAGNTSSSTVTVTVSNSTTTPGQLLWVRNMVGSYRLLPAAVAVDHGNNVVAVGSYSDAAGSQSDLGGGPMPYAAGFAGFVVKYTPQNGFLWAKSLASGFTAVAVDSQNNILVTGNFVGTVDFGGVALTSASGPMGPTADVFVAKYSASGTLVWVKQFGGNSSDGGTAIAVDGSDNVVFAAQFSSTAVNFGTGLISTLGDYDIVVGKLSGATGATLWARGMGSTGYDIPNGVAADRSGDVFLTGQAGGAIDLGGGAIGNGGIIIAKYSGLDGTYKWAKAFGGVAGKSIAADPLTGNVFVTGQSSSIFLNAYDPSGNPLWAKTFGGSADVGQSVSVDGSGNLVFTGSAGSGLDFAGNGTYLIGGSYYVAEFTTGGAFQWAQRPSRNGGVGTGIAFDSAGHVVTTGNFYSTADFGGIAVKAPTGVTDGLIAQYSR